MSSDRNAREEPETGGSGRFIVPPTGAHAPPDDLVTDRLRGVFRRLIRPQLEPNPREPRRHIRGPGPVHRIVVLAAAAFGLASGGCGGGDAGRGEFASAAVEVGDPPPTRTDDVVDDLHGAEIADPYRWLEDQQAPETREWIDTQNAYTDAIFAQLPGRERLTDLVTRLLKIDTQSTPTERGGRYFFTRRGANDDLGVLYYREDYTGEDQVLIDPQGMSPDHTTSVGYEDISDDGTLVAYWVREGGMDETSIRIRNVDAGEDLEEVLPTARYGSVELAPDASGLFYVKFGSQEPRIYHHRMGTDPAEDIEIFGEGYTRTDIPRGDLSPDGSRMLVTVSRGSSGPTELYLLDIGEDGKPSGDPVEVIADGSSRTFGGFAGDRLLLTTDLDAPNGRVVAADLDDPSVEHWTEIVPERPDRVIQGANAIGGQYFVSVLEDVQPRVIQFAPDGHRVQQLEFETIGSTSLPRGEWDKSEAFVSFTSFTVPTTSYRLDVDTGKTELWFRTEIPIDTQDMEVGQVRYPSRDGTEIPMFVVHRRGIELDGSHPTYLTGYGGFDISLTPSFSATAAAWVSLGGVYAVANLRGGGEFGESWHEAGMLDNKQNVFDDFIAAAEYLIDQGYTSPEHLAIAGGSNGGLLVGAAMTQRPDLFGAVVCSYPLLDMLRYDKFLVARFWVPEYGSADDAEQFEYLREYSPYQNVEAGTEYPATLFITGDGDTRVDPLHGRKMAARVQAAQAGDEPILLRYHTKAGHSGGQPVSERIGEMVDTMSFLLWQVGGG